MQGLFKVVAFTAPAILIVIIISFWLMREHHSEMQVESAAFDRDWNEGMTSFASSKAEKKRYQARAAAAQTQMSTGKAELAKTRAKVEETGRDIEQSMKDVDQELKAQAEKGGK